MNGKFTKETKEFVSAAHTAAKYDLLRYSSGNLSCRIMDNTALLSASRSWLADLTEQQVAICDIETEEILNDITPTVEARFHLGILKQNPNINVVLHFQSPYATAIACSDTENYNFNVLPEIPYYIGKIGIVEYAPPGSEELADAVIKIAKNSKMVIMKNHGLVTVGSDYKDAIRRAGFFELACQILLTSPNPVLLNSVDVNGLINSSQV